MSTVCLINPPGHDWANALACRWCASTRSAGEAIVSGLSSRRGGDENSARALLDAHRAEVLAADGQAYVGELAMLSGLVATLTAVVEHGDLDDVRKLLAEHRADDAQARAEASGAPAPVAPWSMGLTAADRQTALLDAIRRDPDGRWKSGRARDVLRALGWPVGKGAAGSDLSRLADAGHLVRHEKPNARWYSLALPGGAS
ncbi:hypothetical protein AB0D49_08510 [Streptomyces sp. NPDC048290]|uniref:hypothetical protein n=1 Tax=Streptomyces sp. NPDC048290 TaxID=3155811 RepID=UPI00343BAF91